MLAAMIPEGSTSAWFFKMTGDATQIAKQVAAFKSLVGSVRFDDGLLQFKVPDGWQRQAGSGMRYATLTCGSANAPLETSVIRLGVQNADWEPYVLENVNRWRGQLGLTPVTPTQLPDTTETLSAGDHQVTLLDIEGTGAGASARMRRPPFAQPPATASPPGRGGSAATAGRASNGFTLDAPSHWKSGRTGGMRKAAFQLEQNDLKAEVTVITLGPSGGEMLPNVNRWRDQVGLEPLDQDQLDPFVKLLTVGGKEGWFVRCLDEQQPQAILAAVVTQGGQAWFFKMMGDRQLVDDESENFERFLESVRFGGDSWDPHP
jgi:hypothetical protein